MESCMAWLFGLGLLMAMFYYGAVLLGLYKGSLMAQFRHYGVEQPVNILSRFLLAMGLFILVIAPMIPGRLSALSILTLALLVLGGSFAATRLAILRDTLPRWYYQLLQVTSRQERRAIAYAWMRLPLRTRLRLNGDNYAFGLFVDEVRLTMIYGARDPDDPWETWQ